MDEDRIIYERLRAGDQDALRVLVEQHHRALFEFLFRMTDNRALADDLAQQVFVRLLSHQGKPPSQLRNWLFTVGRNLAYDHFRSAKFRYEQMTDFTDKTHSTWQADSITPEQIAIRSDQQRAMADLLQRLPPDQRETIILRFYHDLTLQEIADVVEAPLGTVKSRLYHALKKLKVYLVEIEHIHE